MRFLRPLKAPWRMVIIEFKSKCKEANSDRPENASSLRISILFNLKSNKLAEIGRFSGGSVKSI